MVGVTFTQFANHGFIFMNMFITNTDHKLNVQSYCDVHLRKMIVEQAQMLSTAHRILDGVKGNIYRKDKSGNYKTVAYDFVLRHLGEDGNELVLYKHTHQNHPNALWIRKSVMNYQYAYQLFVAMLDEYVYRFDKVHKSNRLRIDLKNTPRNLKPIHMTPFVWDEKYSYIDNVEEAYRKAFVDKFRDWSHSNSEIINGVVNPSRKRLIDISWTRRTMPSFIDDETADMIQSYHAKSGEREMLV